MALETNMEEKTLVARRTIKDYIRYIGGIKQFEISDNLEERKATDMKSSKRKRGEEELVALKKRKIELFENAAYLRKESDKTSDKAEKVSAMKEQLALISRFIHISKCP